MKAHRKNAHKKHAHADEQGYISTDLKRIMSRNEKIIMGVLVGGIVIFLILSVILLFGKGSQVTSPSTPVTTLPTQRVNTTPYPTIPPIKDMTVMINARRLNPQSVTIKAGNNISFFNIGTDSVVIEGADSKSSFLNFTVAVADAKDVKFTNPGTYTYKVKGTNLVGTIIIQ